MEKLKKTKKFIFTAPFQKEGQLNKVIYQTDEKSLFKYGETSFPIIPAINAYVEENDKIEIISIMTDCSPKSEDYPNSAKNYGRFKAEIKELAKKNNFKYELVEIATPYNERIQDHLQLYADIISKIGDDEIIYADITYGTKPTPIVLIMALNYAYKLRKNTDIGAVIYGSFDPVTANSYIHDVSPLFFMDAISGTMAQLKLENPGERIKALIEINLK